MCWYHGEIPSSPSVPMVHRDGTDSSFVCVCMYHGEIPSSPSVPMVHRNRHMCGGTMGKSHQVLVSQWYTGIDTCMLVPWGNPIKSQSQWYTLVSMLSCSLGNPMIPLDTRRQYSYRYERARKRQFPSPFMG